MTFRNALSNEKETGSNGFNIHWATRLTWLIAAAQILTWAGIGHSQNLIPDDSFQAGSPPWVLSDYASSIDSTVGRTDSRSLRLTNDGASSDHNAFQERIGGIQQGVEYDYQVFVRGNDVVGEGAGGKPLGVVRWRDSNGIRINLGQGKSERYVWADYGTYGWRTRRIHLEAPPNAAQVDIGFRSWFHCLSGTTNWDDVSLMPRDFSHRGMLMETYQAEDASTKIRGTIQSNELGYTGSGFFEPTLGETSVLEWNNVYGGTTGGTRILSFRYSLEGWEKQWQIFVNGVSLGNVQPTQTGMVNSWATFDQEVTLEPGNNVVRISLPSYDGKILLRIDKLALFATVDTPVADTPTIDPDGGPFSGSIEVNLASGTPDATIYFTIDGSTPSGDSDVYTAPFALSSDTTVQAFAGAVDHIDSPVAIADFILSVVAPTITPDGGTFSGSVEVSLQSETPGSTIHYTADGSVPNNLSPIYMGPFTLSDDATVQAFAVAAGYGDSSLTIADFTVTAVVPTTAAPTITPDGGTFSGPVEVRLATSTPGAAIHYTTDGSTPEAASPVYAAPFTLNGSATVKAFSVAAGYGESPVVDAVFTIDNAAGGGDASTSGGGGGGCFISSLQ